jgi:hypothetical protein
MMVQRILAQIARILEINPDLENVTVDVVESASENLVIGSD